MQSTRLLIETRFAPPRIGAQHVARTELLNQLAQTGQCTLALVTGSAGYGKTTLLAQWRHLCLQTPARVAWLSLTTDDKSLADFCVVFFAALHRLGIAIDLDMPIEGAGAVDEVVSAIRRAVAELTGELYLILDDYHHIDDPGAHALTQALLDRCPSNLHLVIASRALPPLDLNPLRQKGQIVEIDCDRLPFSAAETRSFINGNLGADKASSDDVSLIHELTGGWPSCLQLIVIMLRNRPGARSRLRDLVWRSNDLQAWLNEEVIAALPAELVEFAETLSLFRRFHAQLATFVTQHARAADLLARMELENLPLQRVDLDSDDPWFRFHPLFGEFLHARVERRSPDALTLLHRRASRWFADHDLLAEAVRHANLAGDVELAAQVIEHAAPATWTLGYVGPMLELLQRLPRNVVREHRQLLLLACLAISVKGRAARGDAGLAELGISDDAARRPDIAAGLALARAVIALQRDDTSRTIELLEGRTFHPVDNPFMHYLMLSALAIAYAGAGRYADAKVLLADHPIPPKDINNDMAILAESAGALTSLLEGDVREAERLASPLLERALKTFGHRSVCANVCSAFLADAFYELNRIDDARETLANRHGLLESSSIEVTVRASLCRARLDLLQTGPDAALAFLRTQSARFRSLDYDRPMVLMLAEQVKINLIKGDRTEANASLQALDDCARAHAHSRGFLVEIPAAAALARARLLLADDPALALQALEDARRHALSLGRGTLLTLVDLLSARALADLGCHDRAMASRTQAVLSGCRNGLFRTFVDEGALAHGELAALVQADTLQEPARQFARDLLAGFPMLTAQSTGAPTQKGASARNGQTPLTQREIEILSLVAQAMSNKRIALALNITVETVKWNLRNIFAKLGVSSRYDAMVWARNHKLIR